MSFYGVAYTPKNALAEYGCGTTLANVTEDIQLISQLTSAFLPLASRVRIETDDGRTARLRMYGSACNQSALVLQAIQDTKVNLSVWLGGTSSSVRFLEARADRSFAVYIGNDAAVRASP